MHHRCLSRAPDSETSRTRSSAQLSAARNLRMSESPYGSAEARHPDYRSETLSPNTLRHSEPVVRRRPVWVCYGFARGCFWRRARHLGREYRSRALTSGAIVNTRTTIQGGLREKEGPTMKMDRMWNPLGGGNDEDNPLVCFGKFNSFWVRDCVVYTGGWGMLKGRVPPRNVEGLAADGP